MKMYHAKAKPIDVHPTRIDEMKRKGWKDKPRKTKPSKATFEENQNGES